jgi:DNA-binding response OmpR family regulator
MSFKTEALIVDDEPHIAGIIKKHLGSEKYRFNTCYSGEEALRRIADNASAFDIVLLDLNSLDFKILVQTIPAVFLVPKK